ncbi:MAG: hypothetical protein JW981_09950, partial [Anaerolineae bacterium]|nr:hypothetical protein [Anaerolineae bacterium]
MKNLFKLLGVIAVGLLLAGSMFISLQRVEAHVEVHPATLNINAAETAVMTLTIDVPDIGIEEGGVHKTIDLWDYTYYAADGQTIVMTPLVYTVTQEGWGSYLNFEISGTHWLSMTSNTTLSKDVDLEIQVTDGSITATDTFVVHVTEAPRINFAWGSLSDVENPFKIVAGQRSQLTYELENYSSDYEDYDSELTYSIINNPPAALGTTIYTDTESEQNYRYVQFMPDPKLYGTFHIEVQVMDTVGVTASDIFTVAVYQPAYLPMLVKNYPPVPVLKPIDNPDADGVFYVDWDDVYAPIYEVQCATNPQFTDSTGGETNYDYWGETYLITPATYYFRARAWVEDKEVYGPWSNVVSTVVQPRAYLWIDNNDPIDPLYV